MMDTHVPAGGSGDHTKSSVLVPILALLALAFLGLLPPGSAVWLRGVPPMIAAVACAFAWPRPSVGLAFSVVVLVTTLLMALGKPWLWQVSLAMGLGAAALLARRVPAAGVPGLATGRVPVAFTIFSGLITPAALLGWFFLFDPDVSDLTALVAGRSLPLVIIGGILFSVATAVFEEGLWRGVAFPALKPHFGVHGAVVLQAVSFGIAHTHGFPRGLVGATLAGSWAVLLGYLRLVSGGLLAPILAHVVADSTIAIIVIVLAQVQGS